ncbi:hypothetical protein B0O99DRAFT_657198 [Bisporella sp. PMI_857]|nr:hypothetical protein B0O99DRAFT_657198 [Bisporella sp. PMI_857]
MFENNACLAIYIDAQTKQQYSWEETRAGALKFGKGLQEVWDWEKGDVLVVCSSNCIDTPAVAFGTIWAGGIVSPANPTYTVDELGYHLKDSGAKAVATQLPLLSLVTQAAEIAGVPWDKIVLIGDCMDPRGKIRHFSSFQGSLNTRQCRRPAVNPKTDLVLLAYSSGTTGHPKGVKLSHHNMMMNLLQIQATEEGNLSPTGGDGGNGDIILAVVPYYHVYGVAFLVNIPAYMGLTSVVMRTYKLSSLLQVIQTFRPIYANLVPPIILHLTKSPLVSNYDISSLRMVMCGAAPLTRELIDGFYTRHGIPVRQVYGPDWHTCRDSIGSVGHLVPNMTAKFCNESGEEVLPGRTGEIFLKGPNIFQGYLNNLHGTLDCLSEDGWFRTGDIGYVDANGNFYITDRAKELIRYNGFQVPPAEIEGHLLQHPQIADVAVIGVMSQQAATELPRAYVVLVPVWKESQRGDIPLIAYVASAEFHQAVAASKILAASSAKSDNFGTFG